MTATRNRAAISGGAAEQPSAGALVRLQVRPGSDLAAVPAAPPGADVTVSFTSRAAADGAAPALEALGYRVVGVSGGPEGGQAVADFLVSGEVLDAHPSWWRSLAALAHQVFNLAFGPAHVALDDVLRTHRGPSR